MNHGGILKLSDSQFVWTIHDFYNSCLNYKILFSPPFQYKKIFYCLVTKLSKFRIVDDGDIVRCRNDTNERTFANCRIIIVDSKGNDLGTFYSKVYGNYNNFKGDLQWISSEDFLKFHVTFDPPKTGQSPAQDCVDNILKNFKKLLLSGHASDVTFNVKGTLIEAHKTVLGAQSQVFDKMFDHEMVEKTSGIVEITDFDPDDFRDFLLYLYTGRVEEPTVGSAVGLYCLADKYNVDVLGSYCVQFLLSNWTVESFCDILALGLRHSETELLDSAVSYLHVNMKQIVCSPNWKDFNRENPDEATEVLMKAFNSVEFRME